MVGLRVLFAPANDRFRCATSLVLIDEQAQALADSVRARLDHAFSDELADERGETLVDSHHELCHASSMPDWDAHAQEAGTRTSPPYEQLRAFTIPRKPLATSLHI